MNREISSMRWLKHPSTDSPREYQCLQLYQQGLTAKETAQKIGLSHRTIEEHFDKIKIKYHVSNKRDLLKESLVTRS